MARATQLNQFNADLGWLTRAGMIIKAVNQPESGSDDFMLEEYDPILDAIFDTGVPVDRFMSIPLHAIAEAAATHSKNWRGERFGNRPSLYVAFTKLAESVCGSAKNKFVKTKKTAITDNITFNDKILSAIVYRHALNDRGLNTDILPDDIPVSADEEIRVKRLLGSKLIHNSKTCQIVLTEHGDCKSDLGWQIALADYYIRLRALSYDFTSKPILRLCPDAKAFAMSHLRSLSGCMTAGLPVKREMIVAQRAAEKDKDQTVFCGSTDIDESHQVRSDVTPESMLIDAEMFAGYDVSYIADMLAKKAHDIATCASRFKIKAMVEQCIEVAKRQGDDDAVLTLTHISKSIVSAENVKQTYAEGFAECVFTVAEFDDLDEQDVLDARAAFTVIEGGLADEDKVIHAPRRAARGVARTAMARLAQSRFATTARHSRTCYISKHDNASRRTASQSWAIPIAGSTPQPCENNHAARTGEFVFTRRDAVDLAGMGQPCFESDRSRVHEIRDYDACRALCDVRRREEHTQIRTVYKRRRLGAQAEIRATDPLLIIGSTLDQPAGHWPNLVSNGNPGWARSPGGIPRYGPSSKLGAQKTRGDPTCSLIWMTSRGGLQKKSDHRIQVVRDGLVKSFFAHSSDKLKLTESFLNHPPWSLARHNDRLPKPDNDESKTWRSH
ncbi:hypothetical protein [Acidiphilium sp. PM]|uniref:hypothetical protein n=1 Tax=Acidiphilium sp. PM TaxID=1043206 RepID=UPI0002D86B67|nr:hypothetical protein [Acidiphilium sp. PM]